MKSFFLIPLNRIPALLALLLAATVLFGAGDDPVRVERLGHQLMCACGCNQILLECNHVGCAYSTSMRSELVAGVGKLNDKGVLQWFVEKYGPTVLAAPPTTGFNRLAWIMPYLALFMGIGAIIWIVSVWRARSPSDASRPISSQDSSELEGFREQVRKEAGLIAVLSLAMTALIFYYIFHLPGSLSSAPEKSRAAYLTERKEAVYENLRDLNFEYNAGKVPEKDYLSMRASLEEEAAALLAEIARLEHSPAPLVEKRKA